MKIFYGTCFVKKKLNFKHLILVLLMLIDEWEIPTLHKKLCFSLKISSVNVTADLVTFTEETLNRKHHFLCSAIKHP